MKENRCDVLVVGAGPAGLAAAIGAKKAGAGRVLVMERNPDPGGILPQCIHNGFGAELFGEDLPGPSFARRFIDEAFSLGVEILCDTAVLDITPSRKVFATGTKQGYLEIQTGAVVLAMGCRERTRAQLRLPGDRPAGVYTAGLVQRLVNVDGFMPGKRFVILGSGDIGMIMARRLLYEGAEVDRVLEVLPYLTGLRRNYVQCLSDYGIPLHLSTTVSRVIGKKRLEAVETVRVDAGRKPVPGTEETVFCDTLLLSVGLIPENELSRRAGVSLSAATGGPSVGPGGETSLPGFFAAGNVVTIYDLADHVGSAGLEAGKSAALYASGKMASNPESVELIPGENVRSLVPQRLSWNANAEGDIRIGFRVSRPFEGKVAVQLSDGGTVLSEWTLPFARPAEMGVVKLRAGEAATKIGPAGSGLVLRVVPLEGL
jgi:NADPH-dependent 2,4-dienoyl-CoA reductase/sulfur reductase-like enzyme